MPRNSPADEGFLGQVADLALVNTNFRKVIHTMSSYQVVLMSIPPRGEIGTETHPHVQQLFYFVQGSGEADVQDAGGPVELGPGTLLIIPPGTRHNVRNPGHKTLKLWTIYEPPNHIDGRIHRTKADADADVADEEFGKSVGG